ncbi:MAG: hypothetical protein UIM53_08680 [Acutalibacteraceae bacterium]|nr:hypothetical protein [Acutalibacteraceae bacterium]
MSFFDKRKKSKKLQSTRQLMEVSSIKDDCLHLYSGKIKVAIIIQPSNLCVLSDEIITSKIIALTNVEKAVANIELLCVNSTQNYDDNIRYLTNKSELETNTVLKELDLKDIEFLNNIRVNMATNREFFLLLTFNKNSTNDYIKSAVRRTSQQLRDGGFVVKEATKDDYKRILAIYYDGPVNEDYSDYDGLKYLDEEV